VCDKCFGGMTHMAVWVQQAWRPQNAGHLFLQRKATRLVLPFDKIPPPPPFMKGGNGGIWRALPGKILPAPFAKGGKRATRVR
jgi:hypothetical protein